MEEKRGKANTEAIDISVNLKRRRDSEDILSEQRGKKHKKNTPKTRDAIIFPTSNTLPAII